MTLCPGLPRWVGTRRINHSGFCWSRDDGVAVASAEPYASYLHFAPEDNHASTSSVRFLRAGCPSWHPTNNVKAPVTQSTISKHWTKLSTWHNILPPCREKAWSGSWGSRGRRFLAVRAEHAVPEVSEMRHGPLCMRRDFYSASQAHTVCYWWQSRNKCKNITMKVKSISVTLLFTYAYEEKC